MAPAKEIIGVVGLGYVGLPLATAFARVFEVVGFDASQERIRELARGEDHTGETDPEDLSRPGLRLTTDPADLGACTFIVVAVPTPINHAREPDLAPLVAASQTVGRILRKGMMVVYESTVYPGVTEETCLPILQEESGLSLGDFDLGYSPERINPGDRTHSLTCIVKVVSGQDAQALDRAAAVYGAIIKAGIHRAPNIRTAEASKVIENVQRDLNIALMNELSKIFARLGIHTDEVLAAAATKWNFHPYTPGLVGGHCIGVDPYYLTHRALEVGYHPEVILAGRRINDSMGAYVGDRLVHALSDHGVALKSARIWLLGLTFKENVPDFRNTRAMDVAAYLQGFGAEVLAWEPLVPGEQIQQSFGLSPIDYGQAADLDAVVLINGHAQFKDIDLNDLRRKMQTPILFDVRNFFDRQTAIDAGFDYRSL